MRRLMILGSLVGLVCGGALAAPWPQAVLDFLADPLLTPVHQGSTGERKRGNQRLATYDVYGVSGHGEVLLDVDTSRIVGYRAPEVAGALPAKTLPRADAEGIAREFCGRWCAEVLAAGEELTATTSAEPAPDCTWRVTFSRSRSGFLLPTRAEVGVQVNDGSVGTFEYVLQGVAQPDAPLITEQRAREIAVAATPSPAEEATALPLCERLWVEVKGLWRPVYKVGLDVARRAAFTPPLYLARMVDAVTGAVVDNETLGQGPTAKPWYFAHGGRKAPPQPPGPARFADVSALPSRDGRWLLISSTRPRPGYPAWRTPVVGLFIAAADGSKLACLVTDEARFPCWSADGQQVAYLARDGLHKLDLATLSDNLLLKVGGESRSGPVWLPDGRLLLVMSLKGRVRAEPCVIDPAQPADGAKPLMAEPPANSYSGAALDDRGRLITLRQAAPAGMAPSFDALVAFDPTSPTPRPEVLVPYPPTSVWLPRIGTRAVVRGQNDAGWWQFDLAANDVTPFTLPWLPGSASRQPEAATAWCAYLPDGETQIVIGHAAAAAGQPAMAVVWRAPAGTGEPTMLLRPVDDEVPMATAPVL